MQSNSISSTKIEQVVRTKKDLYEAAIRNGYYLPPMRDSFVTADFLDDVRIGACWLPKTAECQVKSTAVMIPKAELATTLVTEMQNHAANLDNNLRLPFLATTNRIAQHKPQMQFMLTLLGNIKPDHELFQKGYTRT